MVLKIKGKTVFLILAGGGMILTAVLAAKNAPDAQKKKEAALQEKRERTGDQNAQLTWFESTKAQFGSYIPAIVSGMVALGSLAGSEILNEKNLKKAEQALDNYKEMSNKLDGKNASKVIDRAVEQKKLDDKAGKPWDKKEEFRIVFQGQCLQFESTRADVIEAIYEANRTFQGRGILTFNEFLEYLGQELDEDHKKEGDQRGWESYVGEAVYGYSWIDFGLKECEDEPWVTEIYMAVYPHFFDENECYHEIDEGVGKFLYDGEEKGANDGKD